MTVDALVELDPEQEVVQPPFRILVVDDDLDQVEVLQYRLQQQGFDTLAATTGRAGVELAKSERPNLVLLDLRLPDTDGFSICEALGDDAVTAGIPVIILSGMERPDIIRRSRAAGCQYFVRKPYDPNALLILIEQAIQQCRDW